MREDRQLEAMIRFASVLPEDDRTRQFLERIDEALGDSEVGAQIPYTEQQSRQDVLACITELHENGSFERHPTMRKLRDWQQKRHAQDEAQAKQRAFESKRREVEAKQQRAISDYEEALAAWQLDKEAEDRALNEWQALAAQHEDCKQSIASLREQCAQLEAQADQCEDSEAELAVIDAWLASQEALELAEQNESKLDALPSKPKRTSKRGKPKKPRLAEESSAEPSSVAHTQRAQTITPPELSKSDLEDIGVLAAATENLPHLAWTNEKLDEFFAPQADNALLRVAVLGVFSSGKSSLINALLGEDDESFLPVGNLPVTAALIELCHGPEITVTRLREDGERENLTLQAFRKLSDQTALENKTSSEGDEVEDFAATTERLIITHPSPLLKQMTLYDTPGFNSGYELHEMVTENVISTADVVLWVFNATKPGSETDMKELTHVESGVGKALGVLNRIDLIRPRRNRKPIEWREELNGVVEDMRALFTGKIETWTYTSAKWIREDAEGSGKAELLEAVQELAGDASSIQAEARLKRHIHLLEIALAVKELRSREELELAKQDKAFEAARRDALAEFNRVIETELPLEQKYGDPPPPMKPWSRSDCFVPVVLNLLSTAADEDRTLALLLLVRMDVCARQLGFRGGKLWSQSVHQFMTSSYSDSTTNEVRQWRESASALLAEVKSDLSEMLSRVGNISEEDWEEFLILQPQALVRIDELVMPCDPVLAPVFRGVFAGILQSLKEGRDLDLYLAASGADPNNDPLPRLVQAGWLVVLAKTHILPPKCRGLANEHLLLAWHELLSDLPEWLKDSGLRAGSPRGKGAILSGFKSAFTRDTQFVSLPAFQNFVGAVSKFLSAGSSIDSLVPLRESAAMLLIGDTRLRVPKPLQIFARAIEEIADVVTAILTCEVPLQLSGANFLGSQRAAAPALIGCAICEKGKLRTVSQRVALAELSYSTTDGNGTYSHATFGSLAHAFLSPNSDTARKTHQSDEAQVDVYLRYIGDHPTSGMITRHIAATIQETYGLRSSDVLSRETQIQGHFFQGDKHVELVQSLAESCSVSLDSSTASRCSTLGEVVDAVWECLMTAPSSSELEAVFSKVVSSIENRLPPGQRPRQIRPESTFAHSFGLDWIDRPKFVRAVARDLGVEMPDANAVLTDDVQGLVDYIIEVMQGYR